MPVSFVVGGWLAHRISSNDIARYPEKMPQWTASEIDGKRSHHWVPHDERATGFAKRDRPGLA